MEFDGYGSHRGVFEQILRRLEVRSVLEFGMGLYSTKLFADHCAFVASVEQESMEWYNKTVEMVRSPHWSPHFEADPAVIFDYYDTKGVQFDLVLSDGKAETRCQVANMAMQRNVPVVALHDAEKIWYYRWNLLEIPVGYFRFDFRRNDELGKVTSILTNRDVKEVNGWTIDGHERIVQAYISPLQPVVQVDLQGNMRMLVPSVKP